ncbi:YggS family pyridoxal phosphate-dependent enzyme [Fervidibacillus halotolerans]|uniref:Pyridoxal phosphate homeostasis protein n=1 Tax=Fervidibacillus halotolerans TaxID=2980027 RepID=A0A9E8M2A4_9BACI|nr:YggS family pyridoxal phosphate-dependent enzyme [Fervidibacillus halotolerans]WAA13670.1 YggS family pyridoxal phosphate-dependent enzyme [Fervidibacillus halotolerans]
MTVKANLERINERINKACIKGNRNPKDITLIAVTKYATLEKTKEVLDAGIFHLGENRDQEFLRKYSVIGQKATWHFIGTLQRRKVKNIIDYVDYIHSLDRLSLAEEIQKRAKRTIPVFVQVNVSGEETKHGLKVEDVLPFIQNLQSFDKIQVMGLMTMAPNTRDDQIIRDCFRRLKALQQQVQALQLPFAPCTELSMGMSNDFEIAIEEGATMIRIGTALIGEKE